MKEIVRDRQLQRIDNLRVIPHADLSNRTSMKTRASAAALAIPFDPHALRQLILLVRERGWPLLMLGGGTNTIFATAEFEGIVAALSPEIFGQGERLSANVIRVGAAMNIRDLLKYVRTNQLMGLEFMTMIPGTVGGALAGNAGAAGWGLCDYAESITVMTRSGRVVTVGRDEYEFGYRHSELSQAVILQADFRLQPLDMEHSRSLIKEFVQKKKGQPYDIPSSGCIFKNPRDPRTGKNVSAGKLIDEAGMKGYLLNGVEVSQDHANFLINRGTACGEDFLAMISLIRDVIYDRMGIELEVEARVVGGPLTSCVLS